MVKILLGCLAFAPLASAAPFDLTHTGRVLGIDGEPINGTHDLTLTLYDAGGAPLWDDTWLAASFSDGYYAVRLEGVDSAWLGGTVTIGVSVGGAAELLPRQELASAPRALRSQLAERVRVVSESPAGTCDVGEVLWDATRGRMRVCVTGTWDAQIALSDGVRQWDDGSAAGSCAEYRFPTGGGAYAGATGSGAYRVSLDGVSNDVVWCDMVTDGGGWTLLFNLDSGDGVRHSHSDTGWWLSTSTEGSAGLGSGHKSAAYSHLRGWDEVLVRVHAAGAEYGYAIRPVLSAFVGQSLLDIYSSGNDVVFTGASTTTVGAVPHAHNTDRSQSASGDPFVNNPHPLKANITSIWSSNVGRVRLGTTLNNSISGYTFGGLGGEHQHVAYGIQFESAPISEYCAIRSGYGGPTNYLHVSGSDPYACAHTSFQWVPADTALFVR